MKLYKGIFFSLAAVAMFGSCGMEDPFTTGGSESTGTLMTKSLAPKLTNTEGINISTRAAAVPSTGDFNVVISRKSVSKTRAAAPGSVEYKYSDMPEVLTLPVGNYKVYAHYGTDGEDPLKWNKAAAWDEPYYYGESEFSIDANKITDDVDPIVAKLANIRVTIVFHPSLLSAMSSDSKVEVRVGDQGVMEFTPTETRSAYFKHVNQSQSLTATFTGTVDGSPVVETEGYDNVAPGNHYRITFRMHGIDDDKPGTVIGGVAVDASVETINMNHTIDGEDEEYLVDDMRPQQGGKDDPTPDDPTPPSIASAQPADKTLIPVKLGDGEDSINVVSDKTYCVLDVRSNAEGGISKFEVEIDSPTLTPDELQGVGLDSHLDLVNPGDLEEALTGLELPVNVGGKDFVSFDITGFMPMLSILPGLHKFILTVGDANGETTVTLQLEIK